MKHLPCLGAAGLIVMVVLASGAALAEVTEIAASVRGAIERHIGERDVLFYAIDIEDGSHFAYQPERASERHIPYSTFKIPNLIIALETGAATSLEHRRPWDQQARPAASHWPKSWQQSQSLESAFKRSAMWYFQDVAIEVGGKRYRKFLRNFEYGNADVPDADDAFWLEGPLKISPEEQALFMEKLVTESLKIRPSTLSAIREVSLIGGTSGYQLYGKTGSGPVVAGDFDGEFEGWLVGWVDRPDRAPVVYSLYVRGPRYGSIKGFRRQMSIRFLRSIGAVPEH
ncbi:MAG: penicillin-binding transpeptidase domain-containing protein [Acidobacteriota bacterium]